MGNPQKAEELIGMRERNQIFQACGDSHLSDWQSEELLPYFIWSQTLHLVPLGYQWMIRRDYSGWISVSSYTSSTGITLDCNIHQCMSLYSSLSKNVARNFGASWHTYCREWKPGFKTCRKVHVAFPGTSPICQVPKLNLYIPSRSLFGFGSRKSAKDEEDEFGTKLVHASVNAEPTDLKTDPDNVWDPTPKYRNEYSFNRQYTGEESPIIRTLRNERILEKATRRPNRTWQEGVLKVVFTRDERPVAAKILYNKCKEHCERTEWRDLGLPDVFMSWFCISCVHVWLLLNRFSALKDQSIIETHRQTFVEDFFLDIEIGLTGGLGIWNPFVVTKGKKTLLNQYHGIMLAFDEGYYKNDVILAEAIYRDVFGFSLERSSLTKLLLMVQYMRQQRQALSRIPDEEFLSGWWNWLDPPIVPGIHRPTPPQSMMLYDKSFWNALEEFQLNQHFRLNMKFPPHAYRFTQDGRLKIIPASEAGPLDFEDEQGVRQALIQNYTSNTGKK